MTTISQQQIQSWKQQHGEVFVLEVENHKAYIRKPNRKDLSFVMSIQDDPIKSSELLLKQCWLDGEEIIMKDDQFFFSAIQKLSELMEAKPITMTQV